MTYLSYPNPSSVPEKSNTIDKFSTFTQSGNLFSLKGIALGYNVTIFGTPIPDGLVNFDLRPIFRGVDFPFQLTDTGRLIDQGDGNVAIEWPI